jgi:hypothetical protein
MVFSGNGLIIGGLLDLYTVNMAWYKTVDKTEVECRNKFMVLLNIDKIPLLCMAFLTQRCYSH